MCVCVCVCVCSLLIQLEMYPEYEGSAVVCIRAVNDFMHCEVQCMYATRHPTALYMALNTLQVEHWIAVGDEGEEEEEGGASFDRAIMPDVIVSLEATDEFLKTRIMNLPENVVAGDSQHGGWAAATPGSVQNTQH